MRAVTARELGVAYSLTGCRELLRSPGFSPQKPEKRAPQRNEQAIVAWKRRTGPGLKKGPAAKAGRSPLETSRGCRRSAR